MAEVWCQMIGSADIGIASQTDLPISSWPYDLFLEKLLAKPQSEPDEVAQMVLDAFSEFYSGNSTNPQVNLSAVDLTRCGTLETSVEPVAGALAIAAADDHSRAQVFISRNSCPSFDPDGFIDIGCFCEFLGTNLPNTSVSNTSASALASIKAFVISSVDSSPDIGKSTSQPTGLSVWFPNWIQDPTINYIGKPESVAYLKDGYRETNFAQSTGWDRFLLNMLDNTPRTGTLEVHMTDTSTTQTTAENKKADGGKLRANSRQTRANSRQIRVSLEYLEILHPARPASSSARLLRPSDLREILNSTSP